jgi:hypothetical protein
MDRGDVAEEEIAHEEGLRQPDAAEILERADGSGSSHRASLAQFGARRCPEMTGCKDGPKTRS